MPDLNKRPVRDRFEEATDRIPSGPLGATGGGDLVGAAGWLAVESTRPVIQFIPGIKQPGYKVTAHSTRRVTDGEEHTLNVAAISENVAKWVAQYTSSPSNVNFAASEKDIISIDIVTERPAYTTYQIVVLLKDPGEVDEDFIERDRWQPL